MSVEWESWTAEIRPALAKLDLFPSFISVEKAASAFLLLPERYNDIGYDDTPDQPVSTEALRNLFCVLPLIDNYNYTIVLGGNFATLNLSNRNIVSFSFDSKGYATNNVQHRIGNTLQWGGSSKRYKLPASFPQSMETVVRAELGEGFPYA